VAVGGSDEGLDLVRIEEVRGARLAVTEPGAPGVRFVLVPAGAPVYAAHGGK
jgi:hypothetical protein